MAAADPNSIGCYVYTYGADRSMNRKLEFYQVSDQAIEVRVNARSGKKWQDPEIVKEDCIWIDPESTTQKMDRLAQARQLGKGVELAPDINFSQLDFDKKKFFISQLQPEGPYRIEIVNTFLPGAEHEHVEKIRFHNPH